MGSSSTVKVNHLHHFEFYGTCNGHRHGTLSRCVCGASRFSGVDNRTDTLVAEYRRGSRTKRLGRPSGRASRLVVA